MKRVPFTIIVFAAFMLAVARAYSQFTPAPIPNLPGFSSGAIAWADFDKDGRMDFLISGTHGQTGAPTTALWRNIGSGFIDVTATVAPGLVGTADGSAAWGDFDNDGRLDFLVTGLTNFLSGQGISQLWRNTGGAFTKVPIPGLLGVSESSVAWADFDNDGRLDFLITGTTNGSNTGTISELWRNTGGGFTNVPIAGLLGVDFGKALWADYDNDGRQDFLITGITNGSVAAIAQLWRNTDQGFINMPIPGLRGRYASYLSWGDFDNDGLLDFLAEGLSTNGFIAELWRNTGPEFVNVPIPGLPGFADGSLAFADYDNDGRLDFLITGLTNGESLLSQLWRNTGDGFVNVPVPGLAGNFDNALAWGDFDNDGRLDFLIAGTIASARASQLWRNDSLASNAPPAAPTGLSAIVTGGKAVLTWNLSTDDHTPNPGLSYNVRIGTAPGASDIVSAPALPDGTLLAPGMGSARNGLAVIQNLAPGQTYYWSVQAVDTSFAGSPFAVEQRFTTRPLLTNPIRLQNGNFQFDFTNRTSMSFDIFVSTNFGLPSPTWTNRGPATALGGGLFRFADSISVDLPAHAYVLRQR